MTTMDTEPQGLVDVTGIPLDQLLAGADTALTDALRQLVADLDADPECLSAFDNYAGDPPDFPAVR